MPKTKTVPRALAALGASALIAAAAVAPAAAVQRPDRSDRAPYSVMGGDGKPFESQIARSQFSVEPPESTASSNLPAKKENVDLISRFSPTSGPGGSIAEGQIADVAVHKDVAYLNSWMLPEACDRGGFFAADISDPANPKDLGFVPALPGSYHGEGSHAITTSSASVGFKGDLLIVNNEPCPNAPSTGAPGGFDLYDVSDPRNIKTLVQGAGDRGPDTTEDGPGSLNGDAQFANSSHSSFLWEDDGRLYAVTVDNLELDDVDIFDVTNPTQPEAVGEFDLVRLAEEQGYSPETNGILDDLALGGIADVFLHDMVVKEINGRKVMLADYWDAGYVTVDVEDPGSPRITGDSTFNGSDPLTGATPPEGNGHQGEFSADNRYILAADEDFSPYRAGAFSITSGPSAGTEFASASIGGGASPATLPDRTLNGPTVYVGYACDASKPVPPRAGAGLRALRTGEEAIAVVQRGPLQDPANPEDACFPGEKAANAIEAGYDAVLFANRHGGSAGADSPNCGTGGFPPGAPIVVTCTTHEALHRIFGSTPKYELPVNPAGEPAIGDRGADVEASSVFDGWGYAHLYRNTGGKLEKVDDYAIQESLDPRFASGFGDLSIHEFATDPQTNLAYSAYYAGGLRVLSFGEEGLTERGAFIDTRGNNFWGVEQFTDKAGNRLIAASDRDYGLYIMRYTGPGAVNAPAPGPAPAPAPAPAPGSGGGGSSGRGGLPGISGATLRISLTGRIGVRVSCPASARTFCRGRVRLAIGSLKLGVRRFVIERGRSATVRVTVPGAARRALRRRTRARVRVTAIAQDATGAGGTVTRSVTLRKVRGR